MSIMNDKSVVIFRCSQSDCGKLFKIKRPVKGGIYNITCPHCKKIMRVNFPGMDTVKGKMDSEENNLEFNGRSSEQVIEAEGEFTVGHKYAIVCPHCKKAKIGYTPKKEGKRGFECPCCHGKIIVVAKEVEPLQGNFVLGTSYDINCPHCCTLISDFKPSKEGLETFECPECRERIALEVRKPTNVLRGDMMTEGNWVKGKLMLLRKWGFNREYPLSEGRTVIGRYDELHMSDISIKNDPTMSRKSVAIDVRKTDTGYMFKLMVLKAANPVLHNNQPLMEGEEVSLNFGDSIILGQTQFRFVKDSGK